jgi:hypothetical protein
MGHPQPYGRPIFLHKRRRFRRFSLLGGARRGQARSMGRPIWNGNTSAGILNSTTQHRVLTPGADHADKSAPRIQAPAGGTRHALGSTVAESQLFRNCRLLHRCILFFNGDMKCFSNIIAHGGNDNLKNTLYLLR